VEFGWSLAFIVGVPLVSFLVALQGWFAPFPVLAVLSLLSLILMFFLLPQDRSENRATSGLLKKAWAIFRSGSAVAGLLYGFFISGSNEMVNVVFGFWLEQSFGLQITALGTASLVVGVSELVGESLVGGLTDRIGKRRAVAAGTMLNCAAAILLPFLGTTQVGAFIGLFLFYITFEYSLVSSISIMTELVPSARAILMSLNIMSLSLGRAAAAILSPAVYEYGILLVAVAAVVFNIGGLIALSRVRLPYETN
jgi:predicted MFS family arabinose efflux permease